MNDNAPALFGALLLAATIGVMSWYSLQPQDTKMGTKIEEPEGISGYYADNDATAAIVPDNDLPITIAQGEFRYTPQGKTVFFRQGMPPTTFPQRQVNLLLRFNAMPKNPAITFSEISTLLEDWKTQGVSVTSVFLDYRIKNPDFKAYLIFVRAFKKHFLKNPIILIPVANISWLDDRHKVGHQLLLNDVPLFLIEMRQADISPEVLQKLEDTGFRFQLKWPADTTPSNIDEKSLRKISFFAGNLLTLDSYKF